MTNGCKPTGSDTPPPPKPPISKGGPSLPDTREPRKKIPMPDGVSISIPNVWTGSLTDRDDMSEIILSTKKLEEIGAGGLDKINFTVAANLEKLPYAANVAMRIAWDPNVKKFKDIEYVFQSNLKSAAYVEQDYRTEYLPKYKNMRKVGEHELLIMVQLRRVGTEWEYKDGDYTKFEEFPSVGDTVSRRIKVTITD